MYDVTVTPKPHGTCEMRDMAIGDIAEINDVGRSYHGLIVLRAFDFWVALNNPRIVWSGNPIIAVRKLPSGTVVTLTVK